jgi:hypothetical protein
MNEHLISDLSRFVDERGVTMSETTGHVELSIVRSEVTLSVLIPKLVLEWWVEVNDPSSGKKVVDWCDYVGYDASTEQELSEDMRADVLRFIENVVARPVRIAEDGRILQWHIGGHWIQVVPLVSVDAQALGRGARKPTRASS